MKQHEAFMFIEDNGMIFNKPRDSARHSVHQFLSIQPAATIWEIEAFVNHDHPSAGESARTALRYAKEYVRDLATALREAFPHRSFVISNRLGMEDVTFYQSGIGGPEDSEVHAELIPEVVYCEACRKRQPYTAHTYLDDEFPQVEWGDCAVCGCEVFVRGGEERTLLRPDFV